MKLWIFISLIFSVTSVVGQTNYNYCDTIQITDEPIYVIVDIEPQIIDAAGKPYEHMKQHLDLRGLQRLESKFIICYVSIVIDKQGKVKRACLISNSRQKDMINDYDKRALDYANRLEFEPAIKEGKPVYCIYTIPIRFDDKAIKKANK